MNRIQLFSVHSLINYVQKLEDCGGFRFSEEGRMWPPLPHHTRQFWQQATELKDHHCPSLSTENEPPSTVA